MNYKKPYTEEMREKAYALLDEGYALLDEGYAPREVAAKLGVAPNTIYTWKCRREAKESKLSAPEAERVAVNPLLLQLSAGNDLSKWAGREVLSLQPRELFALLRALNIEGELTLTQKVNIGKAKF